MPIRKASRRRFLSKPLLQPESNLEAPERPATAVAGGRCARRDLTNAAGWSMSYRSTEDQVSRDLAGPIERALPPRV